MGFSLNLLLRIIHHSCPMSKVYDTAAPALLDLDEVPLSPDNIALTPSYLKDHRKRLRRRFMDGGGGCGA